MMTTTTTTIIPSNPVTNDGNVMRNESEVVEAEIKDNTKVDSDSQTPMNEKFIQSNNQSKNKFIIDRIVPIPGTHLYQQTSFENINQNQNLRNPSQRQHELKNNTLAPGEIYSTLSTTNRVKVLAEQQNINTNKNSITHLNRLNRIRYNNLDSVPENRNKETFRKATLILEPISFVVAGNGGTAISNPISHAVLRKGVLANIQFRPEAVAIAGVNGKAHAQSDLFVDYVYRK